MKTFFPLPFTIVLCLVILSTAFKPDKLQLTNSELSFVHSVTKILLSSEYPEVNRLVDESVGEAWLMYTQKTFLPKSKDKANALISVGLGNNGITAIYTFMALQILLETKPISGIVPFEFVTVLVTRESSVRDDVLTIPASEAAEKKETLEKAILMLEQLMTIKGEKKLKRIDELVGDSAAEILVEIGVPHLIKLVLNKDGKIGTGTEGSNIADKLHVGLEVDELIAKLYKVPTYAHDVSSGLGANNKKSLIQPSDYCNSIGRVHPKQRPQGVVITSSFQNTLDYINTARATGNTFGKNPAKDTEIMVAYVPDSTKFKKPTESLKDFTDVVAGIEVTIVRGYTG